MIQKNKSEYTGIKCRARQRMRVLGTITDLRAGLTSDECEVLLGMPHQTCSARFTELKNSRHIQWAGKTRMTRQGRQARVYRATGNGIYLARSRRTLSSLLLCDTP